MKKLVLGTFFCTLFLLLSACQQNPVSNILTPSYPTDMTLQQSVQDALASSDDPALIKVHVETNQNVVILSGYVKKIRQSDTAEQIASKVPGVQSVKNNLIVRP